MGKLPVTRFDEVSKLNNKNLEPENKNKQFNMNLYRSQKEKWDTLKEIKNLKFDYAVADALLDSYYLQMSKEDQEKYDLILKIKQGQY